MTMKRIMISLAVVVLLVGGGIVLAQSSASFNLPWHVVGGGGGRSFSSGYRVAGTVGQGVTSPPRAASANFVLGSGYWAGIQTLPADPLPTPPVALEEQLYLPLICRGAN